VVLYGASVVAVESVALSWADPTFTGLPSTSSEPAGASIALLAALRACGSRCMGVGEAPLRGCESRCNALLCGCGDACEEDEESVGCGNETRPDSEVAGPPSRRVDASASEDAPVAVLANCTNSARWSA